MNDCSVLPASGKWPSKSVWVGSRFHSRSQTWWRSMSTGMPSEIFGIVPRHLDVLTTLPFYHKDPFDRLIIAQGQAEDIPILI